MNNSTIKEISKLIPLFLVVLAIAIGARMVSNNAINQASQDDAEQIALQWSTAIVEHIPQIEKILMGEMIVDATIMTELLHRQPKEIKAYRIYDNSKALRLEQSDSGLQFKETLSLGKKTLQSMDKIDQGQSLLYYKVLPNEEMGDRFGSRMIAPLTKDNQKIGYIEILTVETIAFEKFRKHFSLVTLEFVVLMLAAFLLPAILYLLRSVQLDKASKELRHSAEHDELTGVLNRSSFSKLMEKEIKLASKRGYSIGVHFIDLDRFKEVNDARGHGAGDEVLQKSAERINKTLGSREHLARLGGDEFAIIQPYFIGSSNKVSELANKIVDIMSMPFEIEGCEVLIGASLGYSHFPRDGKKVSDLLHKSDVALYKAKKEGRNRALEFDLSMDKEQISRREIGKRMRNALAQDEFYLNFQPYFDLETRQLRGFEALLRLNDTCGNPIGPDVFIPIAEELGLIGDIGAWVLEKSCEIAKEWPQDLMVSVNISPAQFQYHNMPSLVEQVLKDSKLNPKRLELEVTEGLLIADTQSVLNELLAIKKLGVSIALDDFGTGYSSLRYLWQFPFDKLKVDKSFIDDVCVKNSKSRDILSTIVALGKVLNLKITAEGVETQDQAEVLKSFNCDLVQGYHFGRPMSTIDVAAMIVKSFAGKAKENNKILLRLKESA